VYLSEKRKGDYKVGGKKEKTNRPAPCTSRSSIAEGQEERSMTEKGFFLLPIEKGYLM